jgi:hypothetical protein
MNFTSKIGLSVGRIEKRNGKDKGYTYAFQIANWFMVFGSFLLIT